MYILSSDNCVHPDAALINFLHGDVNNKSIQFTDKLILNIWKYSFPFGATSYNWGGKLIGPVYKHIIIRFIKL